MWRPSVVAREIGANLLAERWRAAILVVITAGAAFLVVATELEQVRTVLVADAELRDAGRYVYVARAEGTTASISPTRCLALGHNKAMVAAGGYTHGGPVTIVKAPGELFEARMIVGDMPTLLSPVHPPSPGDLYISQVAATRAGLADGGQTLFGDVPGVATLSVLDTSARIPDPGPWMWIRTSPHNNLDECWAEVIPESDAVAQQWLTAWLSQGDGTVIVTRFLGEDRLRRDPIAAFHERPNRYAWAATGVMVGTMFWLITWFRRSEVALYRTVGSSRSQTALIFALPSTLLIGAGAFIGALYGLYLAGLESPVTSSAILTAARQALLTLATALLVNILGTLLTVAGSVASYIRQRL
jgi:hypothetical protein